MQKKGPLGPLGTTMSAREVGTLTPWNAAPNDRPMGRPNLFEFATSELSQDAFLCWLAALAGHDEPDLPNLGRSFIAWLWRAAKGDTVAPQQIELLGKPRTQWEKIDITFEVAIDGSKVRFIIEDKTGTTQHDDQLKRYRETAEKDGSSVVAIYFKTGYHFGSDVMARQAGYAVIGLKEWVEFLGTQTVRNDILDDYRAQVGKMLKERDEALALLSTSLGFQQFHHAFAQHEFIGMLADRCPDDIGGRMISRGSNMDGSPWTNWRFVEFSAVLPGGVNEYVFHRIDKRQNEDGQSTYYLSTRQYAVVKGVTDAPAAKLARLTEYRQLWRRVIDLAGSGLTFDNAATDRRGKNESEVGVLFFDDKANSLSNVLEMFPTVHRAFVAGVRALRGVPGGMDIFPHGDEPNSMQGPTW